ncbi:MAG: ribosomal protein S4 [Kiritimatiellia bacterium]|jgi:ribosomal protein S4
MTSAKASRMKRPTSTNLQSLLQSHLDNIVWRLGLAVTIPLPVS